MLLGGGALPSLRAYWSCLSRHRGECDYETGMLCTVMLAAHYCAAAPKNLCTIAERSAVISLQKGTPLLLFLTPDDDRKFICCICCRLDGKEGGGWKEGGREEEELLKRKRGRTLACLCCDPSFFFLPCLLEGTKERQCQDVESISPSSGHRAALPASDHKESIILIYCSVSNTAPRCLMCSD